MEKTYIRLGEIPEYGRSVNFLKMTSSQKDAFHDSEIEGADTRADITEECKEGGVSVFEIGKDGMPVFENLRQVSSFCCRYGSDKIYEVSGEEVGSGQDGEPLLSDVDIIKSRRISAEKARACVLSFMCRNFKNVHPGSDPDGSELGFFHFYEDEKINIITGERAQSFAVSGSEWVKVPGRDVYNVCGWTFSYPVPGLDTCLGI